MPDVNAQVWAMYRGEARSIALTGTDNTNPTAWTLVTTLAIQPGGTPVLSITPTVSGTGPYVITTPFTRAQTSALTRNLYYLDVWRTDPADPERLAGGTLSILTPEYPPA